MSRRIDEYVLYGICRNLERVYHLPTKSVKIRTRDDAYDVFVQKHDKSPTYPFSYLTFTSGTINDTENRPDATARCGLPSRLTNAGLDDTGLATSSGVAIVPYTFNLTFNYVTQDYNDVLIFNARNAFSRTKSKLDFDLEYKNLKYYVKVEPNKDVTLPLKSKLGLDAGAFEMEVDLTISGYVSSPEGEDDFDTPIIKEVNLEVTVPSELPTPTTESS